MFPLTPAFHVNGDLLAQAEVTLEHEVAALAKEKELMATTTAADNDVIYLNVGGTVCATKRSTLTQVCTV